MNDQVSENSAAKFNYKVIEERLKEDNKFLSDLLKILPNVRLNGSEDGATDESSPYLLTHGRAQKSAPVVKDGAARAKSLEELHARLKELHGKKLDYKEKLMKKKLKNQIKKKKKSKGINMKRSLVKLPKSEREGIADVPNGITSHRLAKPVFNSAGKMVFSKFDFRSDELVESDLGKRKKKEDLKKVLERLKKEKVEEKEGGEEVKKAKSWATALARSRGEKVLDDPELLKKAINRAEAKKRASKKKWVEREENVRKGKEERETKRSAAISAKKQEKKSKKLKKAAKKGRYIPGFS